MADPGVLDGNGRERERAPRVDEEEWAVWELEVEVEPRGRATGDIACTGFEGGLNPVFGRWEAERMSRRSKRQWAIRNKAVKNVSSRMQPLPR